MIVLIVAEDLLAKLVFVFVTKMGSNSSKQNNEAPGQLKKNDDVDANSDPRSPTPEIVRTPLQVLNNYVSIRSV